MTSLATVTPNADAIMDALQLDEMSPEEQEEILLDIGDLIFRGTMVRLVERMDGATRDDFTALMEADATDEEVEAFLKERVPDADKAVEETVKDLTDDILAATAHT